MLESIFFESLQSFYSYSISATISFIYKLLYLCKGLKSLEEKSIFGIWKFRYPPPFFLFLLTLDLQLPF